MARLRTPTDLELEELRRLAHANAMYDPVKAHEYYIRTRDLKGRKHKPGDNGNDWKQIKKEIGPETAPRQAKADSRKGKTVEQIHKDAVARQKKVIAEQIAGLQDRLGKLEAKIRKMEHESASKDRKSAAKKERAAKEKDKPKTAAEKAQAARDNKKYRDKNQQKLKSKDGGSSKKGKDHKSPTVSELRSLATKVKGQIAVAKAKLAAL